MIDRLLIFDFDGTLADTAITIIKTMQMTMEQLGLEVRSHEVCASTIGLLLTNVPELLYPGIGQERSEEFVSTYRRIFEDNKDSLKPVLFPGVEDTLRALREQGYSFAIASSRRRESVLEFLDGFGLREWFPIVLGGEDTQHPKPAPDPVLKIMELSAVEPSHALVIGDMPYDIQMGVRAGLNSIGVSYGNSTPEALLAAGAYAVLDSFPDLQSIINKYFDDLLI